MNLVLFCFRETIRFELLATHTHRGKDTDSCIRPLLSLRKSFLFVLVLFSRRTKQMKSLYSR